MGKDLFATALESLPAQLRRKVTIADARYAIQLAAEGVAYEDILERLRIHPIAWSAYQSINPSVAAAFTRARLDSLERRADRLLASNDDISTVVQLGARRLTDENLRWLLGKRLPRQYGEALALTVSAGPDVRAAMARAQGRVAQLDSGGEEDISDGVTIEDEVDRLW